MVEAFRAGDSQRSVARRFGVALRTVQRWLERAGDEPLESVDLGSRSSRPHQVERTAVELEDGILEVRRALRDESELGEYGAAAIRRALLERGTPQPVPSARTIGRILERRGALDARRRIRRPAPPPGWYLPAVTERRVELDSIDIIEGLRMRGGIDIDVLTCISLHGALPAAWVERSVRSRTIADALVDHWRAVGLPGFAQFDNDPRFHGTHGVPDVISPVARTCLAFGVTPVFAPFYETGFQAAIESFNGRWQTKVWARFWADDIGALRARSARYLAAHISRHALRIEAAPARRPIPDGWHAVDPRSAPHGRMVFLRRTGETGAVKILGRFYEVDAHWPHRLVRAELDLDELSLRFFALRRREPSIQPLLCELPWVATPHRTARLQGPGTSAM